MLSRERNSASIWVRESISASTQPIPLARRHGPNQEGAAHDRRSQRKDIHALISLAGQKEGSIHELKLNTVTLIIFVSVNSQTVAKEEESCSGTRS